MQAMGLNYEESLKDLNCYAIIKELLKIKYENIIFLLSAVYHLACRLFRPLSLEMLQLNRVHCDNKMLKLRM